MTQPLTRAERRQAMAYVAEHDANLADRMAAELELDPAVRVVASRLDDLVAEMRQLRASMLIVVILTLLINAGLVGLGVSVGMGVSNVQVTPAHVDATVEATAGAAP